MLEVIVPAVNTKLTTLNAVKMELSIEDTSQDAFLEAMIEQASDAIERYCNRTFALEKYRETIAGYGGLYLTLSKTPIVSIESIVSNSETITDYVLENAESGLLYRKRGWKWTPAVGWNITWHPIPGAEVMNFTIEYTAGYILPGDVGTRTLPHDIERACIEIVKSMFQTGERDPYITSEKLGDYSVSYSQPSAMPQHIIPILSAWRRF